jgi:hypothetical protein
MDKDTPETVYECPVCQEGLPLKRMARHISYHYSFQRDLITSENDDYIRGLLDVIKEVFGGPKSRSEQKRIPVKHKKRYFTQYWTNETWRREATRGDLLEHTAGNQFRKKGVHEDDEIYIITVLDGKMMLGGKIFVEKIVGQREAAKIFGVEPRDLWEAKEHIIGGDEYTYDFTPDKEVPWEIAKIVTVINSDGERGLKRTPDGRGIDPQTIRGVCEINERSARRFDALL